MKNSILTLIKSRLKFGALLLVFLTVAAGSWWAVKTVPEEVVSRMLAADIEMRAQQWKRRVLAQIAEGSKAFQTGLLTRQDIGLLNEIPSTSDVYRLKLYQKDGRVFWASRDEDIGGVNRNSYFANTVAAGRVYQKHVQVPMSEIDGLNFHLIEGMADTADNADNTVTADTVDMDHSVYEIYEPVTENGRFVGAIEFYTDVTRLHRSYVSRIETALTVISAVILALLALFTLITAKAGRWQVAQLRQRADNERDWREKDRRVAREVKLLGELNEWLQSSRSLEELFDMVARFMTHMLPQCEGSVYVYSNSRDVLDGATSWNGGEHKDHIHPEACWGLRRGRPYAYGLSEVDFVCEHAEPHDHRPYFCFPVLAHGETVGLMHLKAAANVSDADFRGTRKLAQMCAEQISMAIANVQMRDQLQDQSVRDPLTGLFNRRHLTDSMRKLILRSQKNSQKLNIVSVDVDHFKKFNDNHGHDAGDMVLRAVGAALDSACDGDEIACRIGGEEFMMLLPALDGDGAFNRAETLRKTVENITVRYGDKNLPRITVSVGLATYPDHGMMPQDLMRAADDALYAAKGNGRNQVVIAHAHPDAEDMPVTPQASKIPAMPEEPDPFRQGPPAPATDHQKAG
jgi:diguanylate cyclase (GGDEF)-like protein